MMGRNGNWFLREALESGWFRYSSIGCNLRSGRKFRYQLDGYPFRVNATVAEIDMIVCQIIKDKYRYCQWDRDHPNTDQEAEIYDLIRAWMLSEVARAQAFKAKYKATSPREVRLFAFWSLLDSAGSVVAEFPYNQQTAAEQRLQELQGQPGGPFRLEIVKKPVAEH
jgi:hypothetical protein